MLLCQSVCQSALSFVCKVSQRVPKVSLRKPKSVRERDIKNLTNLTHKPWGTTYTRGSMEGPQIAYDLKSGNFVDFILHVC